jgi:hypothetical protein
VKVTTPLVMDSIEPQKSVQAFGSPYQHAPAVASHASFAERDSNESISKSQLTLTCVTLTPSSGQHSSWSSSSKRASVGLPTLYPGFHRNNTLAETVLEELQDFDELFEQSCYCLTTMRTSNTWGEVSYIGNRLSRFEVATPVRKGQRGDVVSVNRPSEEEEKAPPPSPRRRGHRRWLRNQAMDQDFINRVMDKINQ